MRTRKFCRSEPGDADWGAFCEWVRMFLYVEQGTGLICYRPRDGSHFWWVDDPDDFALEWNAGSAERPVFINSGRRFTGFVTFDGCKVCWRAVRMALGMLDKVDPNRTLPNPDHMTYPEITRAFGIGYALMHYKLKKKKKDREAAAFEKAVARYEARIGRALAAHEKKLAKDACKMA